MRRSFVCWRTSVWNQGVRLTTNNQTLGRGSECRQFTGEKRNQMKWGTGFQTQRKKLNGKRSETKQKMKIAEKTNKLLNTGSTLFLISTIFWNLQTGRRVISIWEAEKTRDIQMLLTFPDSYGNTRFQCQFQNETGKNVGHINIHVYINTKERYKLDFKYYNIASTQKNLKLTA